MTDKLMEELEKFKAEKVRTLFKQEVAELEKAYTNVDSFSYKFEELCQRYSKMTKFYNEKYGISYEELWSLTQEVREK